MYNKLRVFIALFGTLLLVSSLSSAEEGGSRVKMVFTGKANKPVSVYSFNPDTGKNRLMNTCRKSCEMDVQAGEKVFILFPARHKKYKTYIRRDQKDANFRDGVYDFDLTYGTPEEEERNYFKSYSQDKLTAAQDKLCDDFEVSRLLDSPKACYKIKPSLPPRMRRSGWCKVAMTVLPNGRNQDVAARSCSEDLFKISSEEAVKLYRYYPKQKNGQAVSSRLITTVNFTLADEKGKIIPPKIKK